jgi:membrane-bound serine protease (ClpP class)
MYFLMDPNIAFVILAVAFMVTIFALLAPGTGILEILSLVMLSMVGYSFANLPVNSWAIVLLLGGIVAVILTLKRSDNRYLMAISILLLIAGMLTIYKAYGQILAVDPLLAVIISASMAAFIWIIGRNTTQAFRLHPSQDPDHVIGLVGRAVTDISKNGSVYVGGENWSAVSTESIKKGSQVFVRERDGLVLKVEAYSEKKHSKS